MWLRYVVLDMGNEVYRLDGLERDVEPHHGEGWIDASPTSPMWIGSLELALSLCGLPANVDRWIGRVRAMGNGLVEVEAFIKEAPAGRSGAAETSGVPMG